MQNPLISRQYPRLKPEKSLLISYKAVNPIKVAKFLRYNCPMQANAAIQEYRPVLTSRVGEGLAWLAALSLGAAWIAIPARLGLLGALPFLTGIVGLMAAGISLSNWMDRQMVLRLDSQGVFFTNGLRRVALDWDKIQQVSVFSGALGKKVQVVGGVEHFEFRFLSEVELLGRAQGQLGFPDGVAILAAILQHSGLQRAQSGTPGKPGTPGSPGTPGAPDTVYYARP
jgi:hypothetical protein